MPVVRKPLDLSRVTPVDLAYAAGIIDGEGCLTIVKQSYKRAGYPDNYWVRAEVGTVDDRICPWLYETFGGALNRKTVVWKGVPRLTYRWSVSHAQLSDFLVAVRPYLKLKGDIANALLECYATRTVPGKNITDEVREQRRLLSEHVKSLRVKRRVA